ncbi:rRNA maturation RNase YbeY [Zooshikella marina]|nr:rRNA maturation RNase YbeY [Zooshikella ganghwensis]MBU2708399.1 rRNA maturation RNase YbeY [Zooshikella ganghwensis]
MLDVLTVDLQIACDETAQLPSQEDIECWVETVLVNESVNDAELSIRVVNTAESAELNGTYRQKHYATNVLSFPADLPEELDLPLLGDLAICADIVASEATIQGKPLQAHWAHMVIHGVLHLLGYDHINDDEATLMESLEVQLLKQLGFNDPYVWTIADECTTRDQQQ